MKTKPDCSIVEIKNKQINTDLKEISLLPSQAKKVAVERRETRRLIEKYGKEIREEFLKNINNFKIYYGKKFVLDGCSIHEFINGKAADIVEKEYKIKIPEDPEKREEFLLSTPSVYSKYLLAWDAVNSVVGEAAKAAGGLPVLLYKPEELEEIKKESRWKKLGALLAGAALLLGIAGAALGYSAPKIEKVDFIKPEKTNSTAKICVYGKADNAKLIYEENGVEKALTLNKTDGNFCGIIPVREGNYSLEKIVVSSRNIFGKEVSQEKILDEHFSVFDNPKIEKKDVNVKINEKDKTVEIYAKIEDSSEVKAYLNLKTYGKIEGNCKNNTCSFILKDLEKGLYRYEIIAKDPFGNVGNYSDILAIIPNVTKVILPVPFVQQPPDKPWCWYTSMEMITRYWHNTAGTPIITKEEAARAFNGSYTFAQFSKFFGDRGYAGYLCDPNLPKNKTFLIKLLEDDLKLGYPRVVLILEGHAGALIGFNHQEKKFFYLNPWGLGVQSCDYDKCYFIVRGDCGTLLLPLDKIPPPYYIRISSQP